jgi:Zn-dependent M16 (insulinase) family peptidase
MVAEKTDEALALLADALLTTDFTEFDRIQDLLLEARNDLRASLVPAGHEYAMSRTARFFHPSKALDETWSGTDQLTTLQSLVDAGAAETLAARFRRLRTALLAPTSAPIIHATVDDTGLALISPALGKFVTKVGFHLTGSKNISPAGEFRRSSVSSAQSPEFVPLEAQVGFAAASFRCSPYGTKESAHEAVLSHWLSNNLLWDKLRVKGGAYGAFAVNEPMERVFSLATYRDPSPRASLEVFRTCLEEAASYPFDAATVERTITGAYSREVQPRSPQNRGFTGFVRRLYGITDELREAKIAALLACTGADLNAAAERLLAYRDQERHEAILGQNET